MSKKTFVISETISEGWNLMKANLMPLILVQLAGAALFGCLGFGSSLLADQTNLGAQVIGNALQIIIQMMVMLAMIFIALKVLDHQTPEVMDLITPLRHLTTFFLATAIYVIIILIGLIMFIVPGVIFAVRFGLYGYYIIDKGSGPVEALEQSWDTVKGASWRVFFMSLLCQLINLGGLLCLVIGLLFTLPATAISLAAMYRKLAKETLEPQEASP